MGFLDKLTGGDATAYVTVQDGPTGPGDTVVLEYEIGGEFDDKCTGLRVGISCVGKWLDEERHRDSDGDLETRQVWREFAIHEQQQELPLTLGSGHASFALPEDALPASTEVVEWTAFASVVRDNGFDAKSEIDIPVRVPGPAPAPLPEATDEGLTLSGLPSVVRMGEPISGTLTVNLDDDVKAQEVLIGLNRRCTYTDHAVASEMIGNLLSGSIGAGSSRVTRETKGHARTQVSGKRKFEPGTYEQFPFTLTLPIGAGPTVAHAHGQADWEIEAKIDRRLRGDLTVIVPVTVV